jgi:hypothetical protein
MFKKSILLLIGFIAASLNAYAGDERTGGPFFTLPVFQPLTFSPAPIGSSYGFWTDQWTLPDGRSCSQVVDARQCFIGSFPAYLFAGTYSEHPELLSGRVLRAIDQSNKKLYGVIYGVKSDSSTFTFYLGVKEYPQEFDLRKIRNIEVVSNTTPQDPNKYMVKPTFIPNLPASDLNLTRFPLAYPSPGDYFITLWGSNPIQTGPSINDHMLPINTTCGKLISGQSNVHCARLQLNVDNKQYNGNPEAMLGRQIDIGDDFEERTLHFIPFDFERADNKSYYFYGQMDNTTFPYEDIGTLESTPIDVRLDEVYSHYGRNKLGLGQLEKQLPLNLGLSQSSYPLPIVLPLSFKMDYTQPHTYIKEQDWFSPNLGFDALSFRFAPLQYNEVIEVPASLLGYYGSATQLLNGRGLKYGNANMVVYDSYSYHDGDANQDVVDLYVKSDKKVTTKNLKDAITVTLVASDYPQNYLFYWNPMGGFIPYPDSIDEGDSPLDSKVTKVEEEEKSRDEHKWTSKSGPVLEKVANNCPTAKTIDDDNLNIWGCTEVLVDSKTYDDLNKNGFPFSELRVNPEETSQIPYTLVEMTYDENTDQYASNGYYYNIYDVVKRNNDYMLYVTKYSYREFSKQTVSLFNEAIKHIPGIINPNYMYALVKGPKTYLKVEDTQSLKGTKTKQKKVKAKL